MGSCLSACDDAPSAIRKRLSAQHLRSKFVMKQLCRIQAFRGDAYLSGSEKEQIVTIERRRGRSMLLSPYPEGDLRHYREVTCHVPDDDLEDEGGGLTQSISAGGSCVDLTSSMLLQRSQYSTSSNSNTCSRSMELQDVPHVKKRVDFILPTEPPTPD